MAALLLVPLPMLQFGALVPVARYLLLAGVTAGLIATEGGGDIPYLFLALMLGHALVYGAGLWLLTRWISARIWALAPRSAGAVVVAAVVLGLGVGLLAKPYVTPFSGESLHSNLLVVLR